MALQDNCEGYWALDESSGTASDSTSNNNDLTNNNTTPFLAAIINNGADIELASSQGFSITDAAQTGLDLSSTATFAGWVKFESLPADTKPFVAKRLGAGNQRSWLFYHTAGNVLQLDVSSTGADGSSAGVSWTPSTATWYHVAMTKNGTSVRMYINGSQIGTTQTLSLSTMLNSTTAFELGRWTEAGVYIDGVMDEWGAWSRQLTSDEILELYNGGVGLTYPFTADSPTANSAWFTA